jgi:hypothetical protein
LRDLGDTLVDEAHPRYFVDVNEETRSGKSWVLLTSFRDSTGPRVSCERINADVSRDSKLRLRLNREYLLNTAFEGNFSITARIETPTGSRPVEVHGYSMIGRANEVVPVGVRGASAMINMAVELSGVWSEVRDSIDQAQRRADRVRDSLQRQYAQVSDSARFQERLVRALRLDSTDLVVGQAAPPEVITRTNTLLRAALAEYDSLRRRLMRREAGSAVVGSDTLWRRVRLVLRANRHAMIGLEEIGKPENEAVVRAIAAATNQVEAMIIDQARRAHRAWRQIVEDSSAARAEPERTVEELIGAMEGLTRVWRHVGANDDNAKLRRQSQAMLLKGLKDGEINLQQVGADINDYLVLTLTDSVGNPASHRSHEVRMRVREFGLIRRVADAVVLVNIDPDGDESEKLSAAQTAANTNEVGDALEFPVGTRGSPTAGVSMTWTYSPRREYKPKLNWLEPGFGFVALAASLPMKRVVITPDSPVKTEAVDSQIAYALGGLLSIFDGSLMLSYGMTLNGGRARDYWGIGISFVNATDKAREVFKGLSR